ncbi:uncharacterized protein [Dysidea avara]|uniref:uncharacterized protein isoform X3 n=1 Tax=Dysidea avara TaxID=196820 RepID=UPI003332483A
MAQLRNRTGRPRKYLEGWGSANTRIYLAKEVFCHWRTARARLHFTSDSEFAKYLLNLHNSTVDDAPNDSSVSHSAHSPFRSPGVHIPSPSTSLDFPATIASSNLESVGLPLSSTPVGIGARRRLPVEDMIRNSVGVEPSCSDGEETY